MDVDRSWDRSIRVKHGTNRAPTSVFILGISCNFHRRRTIVLGCESAFHQRKSVEHVSKTHPLSFKALRSKTGSCAPAFGKEEERCPLLYLRGLKSARHDSCTPPRAKTARVSGTPLRSH